MEPIEEDTLITIPSVLNENLDKVREKNNNTSQYRLGFTRRIEQPKEEMWVSCCMRMNPKAVVFFSQLAIALTVIAFCIVQLSMSESCEQDSLYSGILMLVVGVYLPSPKI